MQENGKAIVRYGRSEAVLGTTYCTESREAEAKFKREEDGGGAERR